MSDVTIFHNPACSTSRKAVDLVRATGQEPTIVEYLKAGWTKDQLKDLAKRMGRSPRDLLRLRGTPAEDLGLTKPGVTDDQILDAMVAHPILVERPIVSTSRGARLGRPVEDIKTIL